MTAPDDEGGLTRQLLKQATSIASLRRELEERTAETTETVANLRARIEALEDNGSGMAGLTNVPTRWCSRTIGAHGWEALWKELSGWVAWIRYRYPLARRIPDCWAEHPEIVEEPTALWLAWQAAYAVPDAPLTAATEWHDRWLPGLLHRTEHGVYASRVSTNRPPCRRGTFLSIRANCVGGFVYRPRHGRHPRAPERAGLFRSRMGLARSCPRSRHVSVERGRST